MKKIHRNKFYSHAFLIPAMTTYFIFFILPNIIGLFLGFTSWSTYNIKHIQFNGLDNFITMLGEPIFKESIFHTFYFAIVTVIITNILGFIFAIVMNSKLKLKNIYRSIFFIPTTLSFLVVAPIFNALYNPQYGPINTFLRAIGLGNLAQEWLGNAKFAMNSVIVMSIWSGIGITIMLYISGLQSVPKEYYEAGDIDGCSTLQKVRYITIPLIIPSITVNLTLSLIGGLKVFGQVFALTNGGPNNATQVFATLIYKNFGDGLLGYSSAIGLAFTIIVCIISFVLVTTMRKLEVEY